MSSIGTIFRFTFREHVRKKSFLISTIVMVLLVVAVIVVPAVVTKAQSGQKASTKSVLYLDDETAVTLSPDSMQEALPGYTVKSIDPKQVDSLRQTVLSDKNDNGDVLVVFRETGSSLEQEIPSFTYYSKDRDSGPGAETLSHLFQTLREEHLLHRSDVLTQDQVRYILRPVTYQTQTGSQSDNMNGFVPAIVVCILLFITIFSYGYWVAMSIASEKTSRVLEILITSTKPSRIVIGKSLAMGVLGFLQLALVLLAGGAAYSAVGNGSISVLSFSGFTPGHMVLLLVYFVLGFALYAMLNAVAGATVSNADDVRSAVQPVTMLGMISFYLAYGSFMAPGTPLSFVASLIPFSAPFSMPARLMMTTIPWWQILLSLLLLAGSTCALAALSIRLYAAAVLHYGRRLKLSDLFRMAKQTR